MVGSSGIHIALGTASNYDFYAFLDLSAYQIRRWWCGGCHQRASTFGFHPIQCPVTTVPIYQEALRRFITLLPGVALTMIRMEWYISMASIICVISTTLRCDCRQPELGNAVSTDLVHWQEFAGGDLRRRAGAGMVWFVGSGFERQRRIARMLR